MSSDEEIDKSVELSEREVFRQQISTMSFEDLLKLKNKIGSKQYNKVVVGANATKPQTSFKRANKNRPRETSSKKRVHLTDTIERVKPHMFRDPRFDPLCGTYDNAVFKSNYKFVEKIKKKERDQLQKEFNDEEDVHKKEKIKLLLNRMDNQLRESEKTDKVRSDKQKEQQHIRTTLMQGEKPIFKKKSEKRIENLVTKYEELKQKNKLQEHFKKQYKKQAHKERKTMKNVI